MSRFEGFASGTHLDIKFDMNIFAKRLAKRLDSFPIYGTFKYITGLISLRLRTDKSSSTVKNCCQNLLKNQIG